VSPLSDATSVFVKPTLETKFHIDFSWWDREGRELRVDVLKHLRPESQAAFANYTGGEQVDAVDLETGEVRSVDRLQYLLRTQCKPPEEFLTEHTSLVDAVPLVQDYIAGALRSAPGLGRGHGPMNHFWKLY